MPNLTASVTLLSALFCLSTSLMVARARFKFNIKAPATSGHPEFERAFRVQMNTLEWMPIFLPSLWLAAFYVSDLAAAALGLLWLMGRIIYAREYLIAAERRAMGFGLQASAASLLWIAALVGLVRMMLR